MGLHSYAEEGTGERMADEAVNLLNELAGNTKKKKKGILNLQIRNPRYRKMRKRFHQAHDRRLRSTRAFGSPTRTCESI